MEAKLPAAVPNINFYLYIQLQLPAQHYKIPAQKQAVDVVYKLERLHCAS